MQSSQRPLGTPFGPATTASEVAHAVNLTGKTAVVTGGASGLGLETVRVLTQCGARVIVPARDISAAEKSLAPLSGVEVAPMDLLDPQSISAFAQSFLDRSISLDLLVLSAGVMATPLFRDANRHEGQFSTNHLGHFRLTNMLRPALSKAQGARVVVLSSRGHQIGGLELGDIDFLSRPYDKWLAYGQAKTANALFALELDSRWRQYGVRAFSVHPGSVLSPLARHLSRTEIDAFGAIGPDGSPVIDPKADKKTVEQGAATIIWCATAPELDNLGGLYCEDCDIAPLELTQRIGVRPYAVDPRLAADLWVKSESMM